MLVITMLLVWIVAAVDKLVMFLLVEPIRQDIGVSDFQMSFLVGTAFALAYAAGGVPFGYLADRVQRKWQIFFALLAWSVFSMACGFAGGFLVLLLMRGFVGLAESAFPPARDSLVADAIPPHRLGLANAVMTSGGVLGGGIALIIGGLVSGAVGTAPTEIAGMELKPWQLVFLVTGGAGLLLLPLLLVLPEVPRRHYAATPEVTGFGSLMRKRWRFYVGVAGATGMLSAASNGMTAWTPAFLHREFGISMMEAGVTLGTVQTIAILFSFLISGWGIDFLFRKGIGRVHLKWTLIATALGAPCYLVAFQMPSLLLFYAFYIVGLVISLGYAVALVSAIQIETMPQYRGRAAAFYYLVLNIVGFGLGPTFVAAVTDFMLEDSARVGEAIVLTVGSLSALAVVFVVLALRQRGAEPDPVAGPAPAIDGAS
jgi:MFS family permease